jgi:hypothetical protein
VSVREVDLDRGFLVAEISTPESRADGCPAPDAHRSLATGPAPGLAGLLKGSTKDRELHAVLFPARSLLGADHVGELRDGYPDSGDPFTAGVKIADMSPIKNDVAVQSQRSRGGPESRLPAWRRSATFCIPYSMLWHERDPKVVWDGLGAV